MQRQHISLGEGGVFCVETQVPLSSQKHHLILMLIIKGTTEDLASEVYHSKYQKQTLTQNNQELFLIFLG